MNFENKVQIGVGIYTPSEIAQILRLPYAKVNRWLVKFWDGRLGKEYETRYSWKTENSKAVGFHTLVEFYVMMRFIDVGVSTQQILRAHQQLSRKFQTAFPFATRNIIDNIRTEGREIILTDSNENLVTLDGTDQLNMKFIEEFFLNLDFDKDNLASRFWPRGKESSILIDPHRKFGHPVIDGSNIYPETIYSMFKAGEPQGYIAYLYELSEEQVKDAIEFCQAA